MMNKAQKRAEFTKGILLLFENTIEDWSNDNVVDFIMKDGSDIDETTQKVSSYYINVTVNLKIPRKLKE